MAPPPPPPPRLREEEQRGANGGGRPTTLRDDARRDVLKLASECLHAGRFDDALSVTRDFVCWNDVSSSSSSSSLKSKSGRASSSSEKEERERATTTTTRKNGNNNTNNNNNNNNNKEKRKKRATAGAFFVCANVPARRAHLCLHRFEECLTSCNDILRATPHLALANWLKAKALIGLGGVYEARIYLYKCRRSLSVGVATGKKGTNEKKKSTTRNENDELEVEIKAIEEMCKHALPDDPELRVEKNGSTIKRC